MNISLFKTFSVSFYIISTCICCSLLCLSAAVCNTYEFIHPPLPSFYSCKNKYFLDLFIKIYQSLGLMRSFLKSHFIFSQFTNKPKNVTNATLIKHSPVKLLLPSAKASRIYRSYQKLTKIKT